MQQSDLLTQLAQIRERQGKEPLPSPNFIQGFGPGSPPPPPPIIVPGDIVDPDEDEPSPLIPPTQYYVKKERSMSRAETDAIAESMGAGPVVPQFKLVVMDNAAQYAGHGVILLDTERDTISGIVVKAVKRELDGEVATLSLREAQAQGLVPPIKRKRGRPRKDAPTPAAS